MKNPVLCKFKFTILLDFMILSAMLAAVCSGIFIIKNILFDSPSSNESIRILTEDIPSEYATLAKAGAPLYDPITKRCIGSISEVYPIYNGNRVKFIIEAEVSAMPRGDSLRTRELWFRFSVEDI